MAYSARQPNTAENCTPQGRGLPCNSGTLTSNGPWTLPITNHPPMSTSHLHHAPETCFLILSGDFTSYLTEKENTIPYLHTHTHTHATLHPSSSLSPSISAQELTFSSKPSSPPGFWGPAFPLSWGPSISYYPFFLLDFLTLLLHHIFPVSL